jgi:hypothetical protein
MVVVGNAAYLGPIESPVGYRIGAARVVMSPFFAKPMKLDGPALANLISQVGSRQMIGRFNYVAKGLKFGVTTHDLTVALGQMENPHWEVALAISGGDFVRPSEVTGGVLEIRHIARRTYELALYGASSYDYARDDRERVANRRLMADWIENQLQGKAEMVPVVARTFAPNVTLMRVVLK